MTDPPLDLRIDQNELNLVDGFRQSRITSVLTIMFTDIQGFTRLTEERGNGFSNGTTCSRIFAVNVTTGAIKQVSNVPCGTWPGGIYMKNWE